jgi:N-methylhydantoinase B/oxoprolinase/acetone carboxylase alpha subunit
MAPVAVVTPPGSLVDATYPAAVGAGNVEVSQRVADVVARALAAAVPERVGAASQGTMNNVLIGGVGPVGHWVYYETVAGGQGGRPPRPGVGGGLPMPGMSGVHTGMTNTDQVDYRSGEPCPALRGGAGTGGSVRVHR